MEIRTKSNWIIKIVQLLTWIAFIGLCMRTGALLCSFFVSLFINAIAAKDLNVGLDLSELKVFSLGQYVILVLLIAIISALQAYMFYLVIKIFSKINFAQPFSENMALLITRISYVAFAIGILALTASKYSDWLIKKGVALNTLPPYVEGGDNFLFLAGIVFIISIVFKRGIEIQSENDLTV